MKIRFRTAKLEKLCNSEKAMIREWGKNNAKQLQQRSGELQACTNLSEMKTWPAARCHQLHVSRAGEFAVDLQGTWRLIFMPDHDPIPRKADKGFDLANITAIIVTEIEDYHG